MSFVTDVFLVFIENFKNRYVKEQSYFYAVGAHKEIDGLLKYLKRSALSLEIHNSCKFKPFELFLRCSTWSSDTKMTSKIVLSLFYT